MIWRVILYNVIWNCCCALNDDMGCSCQCNLQLIETCCRSRCSTDQTITVLSQDSKLFANGLYLLRILVYLTNLLTIFWDMLAFQQKSQLKLYAILRTAEKFTQNPCCNSLCCAKGAILDKCFKSPLVLQRSPRLRAKSCTCVNYMQHVAHLKFHGLKPITLLQI